MISRIARIAHLELGYLLFGSAVQPSAIQNVGWTLDFQMLGRDCDNFGLYTCWSNDCGCVHAQLYNGFWEWGFWMQSLFGIKGQNTLNQVHGDVMTHPDRERCRFSLIRFGHLN